MICYILVVVASRLSNLFRHDRLISKLTAPVNKREPFCAFAAQFLLDRIIANLVEFQKLSMSRLNAQRSYGYWSLRRCDVYVAAFQPGLLFERLELVNLLWKNGISADLMYEGSVPNNDIEDILDQCHREGILLVLLLFLPTYQADQEILVSRYSSNPKAHGKKTWV